MGLETGGLNREDEFTLGLFCNNERIFVLLLPADWFEEGVNNGGFISPRGCCNEGVGITEGTTGLRLDVRAGMLAGGVLVETGGEAWDEDGTDCCGRGDEDVALASGTVLLL